MKLNELINRNQEKLSQILASDPSDRQKLGYVRNIIHILCDSYSKLDKSEHNLENFVQITIPCKLTMFNLAGTDDIESENIEILKRVKNWIKEGKGARAKSQIIDTFTDDLGQKIYEVFSLTKKQWNILKEGRDKKNEQVSLEFNFEKYLKITKELLLSDNWKNKAVGLLASTGRRLSELFTGQNFTYIQDKPYHLAFSGQLKTKSSDKKTFDIGCLFSGKSLINIYNKVLESDEVKNLFTKIAQELENEGVDKKDEIAFNEKIDDKFNHHLNLVVKNYYSFLPTQEGENLTAKTLRKVCSSIIVNRECDITDLRVCLKHYNDFLGHKKEDKGTTTLTYIGYKLPQNVSVDYYDLDLVEEQEELEEQVNSQLEQEKQEKPSKRLRVFESTKTFIDNEKLEGENQADTVKRLLKELVTLRKQVNKLEERYSNQLEQEEQEEQKTNYEDMSLEELRGKKYRNTQEIKLKKTYQAITNHNDTQPSNETRFKVTTRLIMELSQVDTNTVSKWCKQYKEMIDSHNSKYNFSYQQNRGKDTSIIDIS